MRRNARAARNLAVLAALLFAGGAAAVLDGGQDAQVVTLPAPAGPDGIVDTLPTTSTVAAVLPGSGGVTAGRDGAPTTLQRRTTARASRSAPTVATGDVWSRLAQCESGGRWDLNTGNGYYGGLQFSLQTWRAMGGSGYPHQHPASVQISVAQRLQSRSGWSQWPACSRKLGLR